MANPPATKFAIFYADVFRAEHQSPANVLMHVAGVALGLLALALPVAGLAPLWLALLALPLHATPGLVGHRLFERNASVGDIRVTRRDYPLLWFILANHVMAWRVATGRRP
jgi:hypothetical protein